MKIIKKNRYFKIFLLIAISLNVYCMNEEQQPSKWTQYGKWAAIIGGGIVVGLAALKNWWQSEKPIQSIQAPLVGQLPTLPLLTHAEPKLPQDMQKLISQLIYTGQPAESLGDAAQRINRLGQVNKEFNEILNDPKTCLRIIKELAKRFNCSDYQACGVLQTLESERRLKLQHSLFDLCASLTSVNDMTTLKNLLIKGVDLDFTYDFEIPTFQVVGNDVIENSESIEVTPLMLSIIKINPNLLFGESEIPIVNRIHQLIESGADINATNKQGLTALMFAALTRNIAATKKLCSYDDLIIDQQDSSGNTALIYSLLQTRYHRARTIFRGITIYILNASADPELANSNGKTPLTIAGHHLIKNDIEAAINKKKSAKTAINQ
jgi:hypothetical protein